jgi:hypothetical protein
MLEAQIQFLKRVKEVIPETVSFVQELADLLNMSADSAYRRIRGDTDLTLSEAILISNRYHISLDAFLQHTDSPSVVFQYAPVSSPDSLREYFASMLNELELIREKKGSIIYAATDLPIFYHFSCKEHAAFKLFGWTHYSLQSADSRPEPFAVEKVPSELISLCHKVYQAYKGIQKKEIWTDATLDSTLKHLLYFFEMGNYVQRNELILCTEQLKITLQQVEQACAQTTNENSGLLLYESEVAIDNNCIYLKLQDFERVYLRYQNFNILTTQNSRFCSLTNDDLHYNLKKSSLLSGAGEKHRHRFFQKMYTKIDGVLKKMIE